MTDTPFTTFPFSATGGSATRTMPNRLADIFNVKDFGALGDGSHDDTTAIRAALTAMWARGASILFFPDGTYLVTEEIVIGHLGGSGTNGRIIGSSRLSTLITGNITNGYIFAQNDDQVTNGPEEISNLSLVNTSTWIGSGALRVSNSSMVVNNCHFRGMTNVLLPFNCYDMAFNNCTGEAGSDATTGYNGTFGIAGYSSHVKNWRSTNPFMTCLQFYGGNGVSIDGCGIENCVTAIQLGMIIGWASSCTVAPDGSNPGSSILTVGGTMGSVNDPNFNIGRLLYGRGLNLPAWGSDPNSITGGVTITADNSTDGTLTGVGFAGTYRISGTYTISTPIPLISVYANILSGVSIKALQTEACFHSIYLTGVAGCDIAGFGFGSNPIECPNQFGTTGLTPRAGIYVRSAGKTKISAGGVALAANQLGGIYIEPSAIISTLTFDTVDAQKGADNVAVGTISNGSGGAGTILNITTWTSGAGIGVGMLVKDAGVTVATIAANHLLEPAMTGAITTGTYRVDTSLNLSSRALTIVTGEAWVMPTATEAKTGLMFKNCNAPNLPSGATSGLQTLNMTFTCLPGEAGANNNVARYPGQSRFIVDAMKSGGGTAAPGDIVAGGGSQKIPVFYDGTSWRYGGAGQLT